MKYVVLVLVGVFAVWQIIGLVKTIKENKNKKALTSSDFPEEKNEGEKMPDSVVLLLSIQCVVLLVDQLWRLCSYIREQREKENSSVPGADEDKKEK